MNERAGRTGLVYQCGELAGRLEETPAGYQFSYNPEYLSGALPPVSLTLPKRKQVHQSPTLFPFFISLLAEGHLAKEQCRALRLDEADLFGRVIYTTSSDVIGSVLVFPENAE